MRLRTYLMRKNVWDKAHDTELGKACYAQVEAAVQEYLAVAPPGTSAMFDHLYATLPRAARTTRHGARVRAGRGEPSWLT